MSDQIDHIWEKTENYIHCTICAVIKGSNPNKESKCPGYPPWMAWAKTGPGSLSTQELEKEKQE